MPADPALELQRASYAYPGGQVALREVSLRVERGERLGVVGPNGGGKSTLLRLAAGLLRPTSGVVRTLGGDPARARRSGRIGYLRQRVAAELDFPISGRQAVELAATVRLPPWVGGRRVAREVDRALDLTGAGAYADRPVGSLSGGQLQRVMIARALAAKAELLLLDEPLVGVDPEGQKRFAELLERIHRELGVSLVIVSHDIRAVAAGCDRVACLAKTLHFHAQPGGLTPQVLAEVFSHGVEGVFDDLHLHAHHAHECPVEHEQGEHR